MRAPIDETFELAKALGGEDVKLVIVESQTNSENVHAFIEAQHGRTQFPNGTGLSPARAVADLCDRLQEEAQKRVKELSEFMRK